MGRDNTRRSVRVGAAISALYAEQAKIHKELMKNDKNEVWRDIPDEISLANSTANIFSRAESLHPGQGLIDGVMNGNPEAIAIQRSWKPRFKITWMTRAKLRALSEHCYVLFTGQVAI